MKKTIILICALLIISFLCAFTLNAEQLIAKVVQFRVFVDGTEKIFSLPIITINDRTYIPLREVAETLGMNVEWNDKDKKIEITTKQQFSDDDLFVFKQNGNYGYMDVNGNIVIDAHFSWAFDFVDGITKVAICVLDEYESNENPDRWGFIDTSGKMIIPCKFDYIYEFNEGLALVREIDKTEYYIDKKGHKSPQKVIGYKFFTKGYMPKLIRGGMPFPMPNPPPEVWSYIDTNGELATDQEFEKASEFSNGLAVVKSNGKYGLIDTKFNIIIDYKYDDLIEVDNGIYIANDNKKWGIIDSSGKTIIKCKYDDLSKVNTNLYAAQKGNLQGLIDISDKVIVDFKYLYIWSFSENLAPFCLNKKWGYINTKGDIIISAKYDSVYDFSDGMAVVKFNGKYGVINRSGDYVIEPKYDYLELSKKGLIKVHERAGHEINHYYIDRQGNRIGPIIN